MRRTIALAIAMALTMAGPSLAETIQQEEGRLLAATPVFSIGVEDRYEEPLPHDGVSFDAVDLVDEAPGASFELVVLDAKTDEADVDICFRDATDQLLGCQASPGDEQGTVPDDAASAGIHLVSGVDVTYRLMLTTA